jgi:Domain of unknown function (DUF4190)
MTQQDGSPSYGTGDQPAAGGPQGSAYPQPAYGQAPYAQPAYGQAPYAPPGHGPAPYGQPPALYAAPYGQPYGYPPVVPQRTNGMAIASMVLGILWLYWIGSVLALVFGYIAKNQIRERGEGGAGMATAGIVLGWIGIGILGLGMLFGLAAYS